MRGLIIATGLLAVAFLFSGCKGANVDMLATGPQIHILGSDRQDVEPTGTTQGHVPNADD
jgi:hypothetical protein